MFTNANPAGDVTSREEYLRFLVMLIFVGGAVSVKRVCLGYYFGRRICGTYRQSVPRIHISLVFFLTQISQPGIVMIFMNCLKSFSF